MRFLKSASFCAVAILSSVALPGCAAPQSVAGAPEAAHEVLKQSVDSKRETRLVLWLTVDQLRGDTWQRYDAKLGEGGFKRLLREGLVYTNAHYGHAITETAPGHATLFTGVSPREHGIIGNSWLRADGSVTTSVSDVSSALTGPGVSEDASPHYLADQGRSPSLLLVPTLGDEIVRQSRGKSKVVAISTKDRSAILPAGLSGHAFWLGTHGFVSSSYYGEVPTWLHEHHQKYPPRNYLKLAWPLLRAETSYQNPVAVSPHAEKRLGSDFPHEIPDSLEPVKALSLTPFGDQAVLDLAATVLDAERLGRDDAVDLLSISLSSTDQIGHSFGPESREMEDQILRLDARLAEFFLEIDEKIGWQRVLVVLSADHGGCESAHYLQELGLPGMRIRESQVETELRAILVEEYGHDHFFLGVESPYVYLNQEAMKRAGKLPLEVRRQVAEKLLRLKGVHSTHVRDDAQNPGEAPGEQQSLLSDKIARSIHRERSGDIYLVTKPYALFLQDDDLAATHGSPWRYDTHVPVVISGAGITPARINREIDIRSLAPSMAKMIGVGAPPAADQPVLRELPY